jgi:hypothetical protein
VAINTIMSLIEHKEFMEFLRLGVVYVHLVACCVAIGLVLTSDIAMVRDLLKRKAFTEHDHAHMESLQRSVVMALIGLWVTGTAIVGIDYLGKGMEYFENPKLHAKVIIVVLVVCRHARCRSSTGLEILALRTADGVPGADRTGLFDDAGVDSESQAAASPHRTAVGALTLM